MLDVVRYNRDAWDRQVREENRWTLPVTPEAVQRAREGRVELLLTPTRIVPREWYGEIDSSDLLCLASGGGQQAPILAAAGASVTLLDNSPAQLEQDRLVAEREGLVIRLELGEPLEFAHTLEDQIGGQLDAGFAITAFFEDSDPRELAARYGAMFIATRALKLR